MKVVGIRHVQGVYEGNNYDNFILYVTQPSEDDKNVYGTCPVTHKIRSKVFYQFVAPENIKKLLNREVEIYYDAYKNVVKLEIQQ